MQIVLFYVMMKSGLVPWLNANNEFAWFGFNKNTSLTVNSIINSFMRFLSDYENKEIVSLHGKGLLIGTSVWAIEEPSTRQLFKAMR